MAAAAAAAAGAFCFQIVLDPSEFKSDHNFPPKLRVLYASKRAHRANATTATKTRRKTLFWKHIRRNSTDLHDTFNTHRRDFGSDLTGCDVTAHARAPDDRDKSAAARICYIVSFAREQSYFVTSQNDAEKFSSPPYLKMTKRAALSGAYFPETEFLMWFHWICIFSPPEASPSVGFVNVAICPTDTFIRHHARAASQFANALISLNASIWSSFHVGWSLV